MKLKKTFSTALIFATAFTGLIAGTKNEAYAYYSIKDGVLEGDEVGLLSQGRRQQKQHIKL